MANDGTIYHLPCEPNNGYVGQTSQAEGKRNAQHDLSGKDTDLAYPLNTGLPRRDLDKNEAFEIGRRDTVRPNGSNKTRGNDLPSYEQGKQGSLASTEASISKVDAETDDMQAKLGN